MKALAESGYKTATLQQLYDHKKGVSILPEKTVVLTFDDGFLDNWTYVYPLLSFYSLKATVFPTVDFIGDGPSRRCLHYSGLISLKNQSIESTGSLRWSELREMSASGVFDVQSHTMTHNRYFCGSNIIDFTGSGKEYHWLAWNLFPERKHCLLEGAEKLVPDGLPVWEFGRSLGVRRFFPSMAFEEYLISNLRNTLKDQYFTCGFPAEEVRNLARKWSADGKKLGETESDAEHSDRVRYELLESRRILETHLNKPVRFLCWPGGARTEAAASLAEECGYLASTVPPSRREDIMNAPGEDPAHIRRIGSCMRWTFRNRHGETSPEHFIALLDGYRGSLSGYARSRFYKMKALLAEGCNLSEGGE